jgi:hypothetical protein
MSEPEPSGITQYDDTEIWRCPQLGGPVTFHYCRRMNADLPCPNLIRCWEKQIDVVPFLETHYTSDVIDTVFANPQKGRIGSIFDTLNRVVPKKTE